MKLQIKSIITLALIASAFMFSNQTQAQSIRAGVYATPSIPIGDFGDLYSFGIGGKVFGNYFINENLHVGIEAGYLTVSTDFDGPDELDPGNLNLIPLQATVGYHFMGADEDFDVYVASGAGLFINPDAEEDASNFGFSPRVGVSLPIGDDLRIDGSVGYTTITQEVSSLDFLAINAGISYLLWD